MTAIVSIKVYEETSGKLLFSRKIFEKSDGALLNIFKRLSRYMRLLAIMSTKRKALKVFKLGKLKHFFNKTKKVFRD